MARAENEVTINKPLGDVFRFVADGLNNPKWRPAVKQVALQNGLAGGEGAEYRQVLRGPGGRSIDGDYRITGLMPNEQLSFEVTAGPARPTGEYYFEAVPGGTKVKFVLEYQPKGLGWLMSPIVTKTMQEEVAQLGTLKQILESGQPL